MLSSRHILIVLITFITICGISSCLLRAQASVTPHALRITSPELIGGRWQLVHASLGLENLPTTVSPLAPTNKPQNPRPNEFRKRKRAAPSSLRFTHDAVHKPRISLKELVVSLRRAALEESKVDATHLEKRGRSRLGKVPIRKGHMAPSH